MKKKIEQGSKIIEKDIEITIRYLKIHNPLHSTREDAIHFLQGMQGTAHILAHEIVNKKKKSKNNKF